MVHVKSLPIVYQWSFVLKCTVTRIDLAQPVLLVARLIFNEFRKVANRRGPPAAVDNSDHRVVSVA